MVGRDDRIKKEAHQDGRHGASALDHLNICTIHEINETDDGWQYVTAGSRGAGASQPIGADWRLGLKARVDARVVHRGRTSD